MLIILLELGEDLCLLRILSTFCSIELGALIWFNPSSEVLISSWVGLDWNVCPWCWVPDYLAATLLSMLLAVTRFWFEFLSGCLMC